MNALEAHRTGRRSTTHEKALPQWMHNFQERCIREILNILSFLVKAQINQKNKYDSPSPENLSVTITNTIGVIYDELTKVGS